MADLPAVGTAVLFKDGETIRKGIVNGEPQDFGADYPRYLPVHVPDTNENMLVAIRNLVGDDA